ncbi:MAG: tetraacyldisaccharide 4'-kinase [Planctomycetia bacterium]|jgi:tetraacyldisaccharide 4'-kinase
MKPSEFRKIVSGREKGLRACAWRGLFRIVETPYTWAVCYRNRKYDRGKSPIHSVEVPVVSVGNLSVGGTGKTPMVHWIAKQLRERGLRVAVISRGYGAEGDGSNDEAMELEQRLPDVPHLENPNRVTAARCAIDELEMQVLLLDDAFQHRRIGRDLDIVLLDSLEPFGFDHVFPRGTLREPLAGLRRADVAVLSRADMISPEQREAIRQRVLSIAPEIDWAEVTHAPESLLNASSETQSIGSLEGKKIAAFCGLGNPAGFLGTLDTCGLNPVAFREFPDHHRYSKTDVEQLIDWAAGLSVDAILCTHKDLVKLGIDRLGQVPLWALTIGIRFLAGEEMLAARLASVVEKGLGG